MKRRTLLGLLPASLAVVGTASAERPNIVFIISDEHQVNALGCYGSPNRTVDGESPTPNLDRLARQGVKFTNAYTPSPLSAPARASLITGVYPYQHTALHHKYGKQGSGEKRFPGINPDEVPVGEVFRRGGYATAGIGKVHVHGELKGVNDLGFDYSDLRFYSEYPGGHYKDRAGGDWDKRYKELQPYRLMKYVDIDSVRFADADPALTIKKNAGNRYYMETIVEKEEQAFDYLVADESNKYIERCVKAGTPFFLWVGFEKPHAPYSTHKRYMDKFSPDNMVLPESWDQVRTKGRYPFIMGWMTQGNSNERFARNTMAAYYACVAELDEQVGRIIRQCEELGILDNTVFVYTSDHGDHMYTHSMLEKHCMFEMASRVPLIISYPGVLPQNMTCQNLVSTLDLMPTILELSSLNVPDSYQGVSLISSMEGRPQNERLVFSEFYDGQGAYKMFPDAPIGLPMRMCRYGDYKYVYTHGFIEQLYDLRKDPNEDQNLAVNPSPEIQRILEKLRLATLDGWMVDECPLFEVNMRRKEGAIVFNWDSDPCVEEYVLYRSVTGNPLDAVEIARGRDSLKDGNPLKSDACYWIVGQVKLEREMPESKMYHGIKVATAGFMPQMPASMRMQVDGRMNSHRFVYQKQCQY